MAARMPEYEGAKPSSRRMRQKSRPTVAQPKPPENKIQESVHLQCPLGAIAKLKMIIRLTIQSKLAKYARMKLKDNVQRLRNPGSNNDINSFDKF